MKSYSLKTNIKDEMTPKERAKALSFGNDVDRMPVYMYVDPLLPEMAGFSGMDYEKDAKVKAQAQVYGYKKFGYDSLGVALDYSMAYALGATYSVGPNGLRVLKTVPMKNFDDIHILDLDHTDIQHDLIARKSLDCLLYMRDMIGEEIEGSVSIRAPLSAISGLIDINLLLKAIVTTPEKVEPLLKFALESQFNLAKAFLDEGFDVSISDPIASGSLISPRLYKNIALPYETELIKRCLEYSGKAPGLHICGNVKKVLEDLPKCGTKSFSLDNRVDLSVAKSVLGDKLFLCGNVDPVEILLHGTVEDVKRDVRECYRKAWDSPCGFVIATGCDMCYGTPLKNIEAYMAEAKMCAREQAMALKHPKEHHYWDIN